MSRSEWTSGRSRAKGLVCATVVGAGLTFASSALAEGGIAPPPESGGGSCSGPQGGKAELRKNGRAVAPCGAPKAVKMAIAAGNEIRNKPYRMGGGHKMPWKLDRAYDCSGTVSWLLHGGSTAKESNYKGLIKQPKTSGALAKWGDSGKGEWITVMANGGHTYIVVAGLRMDTSGTGGNGPSWTKKSVYTRTNGPYKVRHPSRPGL